MDLCIREMKNEKQNTSLKWEHAVPMDNLPTQADVFRIASQREAEFSRDVSGGCRMLLILLKYLSFVDMQAEDT